MWARERVAWGKEYQKKKSRDPRCGLSVEVLHTIVKNGRVHPHEINRYH
jgi:hypothetical protein